MEVKAGDWGTLQRLVLTVGEGRWLHLNEKAFDVQVYTEKGAPGPQEKFKSEKQTLTKLLLKIEQTAVRLAYRYLNIFRTER